MKKKIIFVLVILLFITLIGFYLKFKLIDNKVIIETNENNVVESSKIIENEEQENLPNNDETVIIENSSKEEVKETNNVPTSKENVINNSQTESNAIVNNTSAEVKEESKPWEELGITEEDYNNKPMWSWMKIDFDVNTYGSKEATENACREYGNKTSEENNQGFSCTNVLSYSGKYLGEYIKFF